MFESHRKTSNLLENLNCILKTRINMLLIPGIKMNRQYSEAKFAHHHHHHHHHNHHYRHNHNRIMKSHSTTTTTTKPMLWKLSLICSKLFTFKLLIIHFIFNFGKWDWKYFLFCFFWLLTFKSFNFVINYRQIFAIVYV